MFQNINLIQIIRFTIGLTWIYHGLVPKLLFIAPLEWEISSSLGLSETYTFYLIKMVGLGEVLFGCLLIYFYKMKWIQYANIGALTTLLLLVAIQTPAILFEAFNPITTNVPIILLSIILLSQQRQTNH